MWLVCVQTFTYDYGKAFILLFSREILCVFVILLTFIKKYFLHVRGETPSLICHVSMRGRTSTAYAFPYQEPRAFLCFRSILFLGFNCSVKVSVQTDAADGFMQLHVGVCCAVAESRVDYSVSAVVLVVGEASWMNRNRAASSYPVYENQQEIGMLGCQL